MRPLRRFLAYPAAAVFLTPLFSGLALAYTEEDLPRVDHDLALACLAYQVAELEREPTPFPEKTAIEMLFWTRVIAAKATPEQAQAFDAAFGEALAEARVLQDQFDSTDPAIREEADLGLTGMGKICWFNGLADEGGPYENE